MALQSMFHKGWLGGWELGKGGGGGFLLSKRDTGQSKFEDMAPVPMAPGPNPKL